ncbi:uncharacterized protein LOC122503219 [Leptopilina heterotoma]|uniref:uncharacterized protein LOC122503219 n=1 Tax=Leptopilina heterotoma TaxID=63436 RepID=UPI001CA98EF2|nr:uncharacterized protein LOC122503219 [Leptopilina heterotoma]
MHCAGRGTLNENGEFFITSAHSHAPNRREEQERVFRQELYNAARNQPHGNREIYNNIRNFHGNAHIGMPFNNMQANMNRWRVQNVPPNPVSIESYARLLNSEEWNHLRHYNNGSLQFQLTTEEIVPSLVIFDPNFVADLFLNAELYIDVSKKAIPANIECEQLLTIMSVKNGYVIPCIWALMTSDFRQSYVEVFQQIRRCIPHMSIRSVVTSYGRNLQESLQSEFPNATISGSLHHFHEELYKKANEVGMTRDWADNDEIRTTFLSVLALPMLPREQIRIGLFHIQTKINNENEGVNNFMDYISTQWIQSVQPHRFSIHRQYDRIFNIFQPYRNRLASKIGNFEEIWSFTRKMVSLQSRLFLDKQKIVTERRNGVQCSKLINRGLKSQIMRAWNNLEARRLSLEDFLTNASYIAVESNVEFLEADYQNDDLIELIVPDEDGNDNANMHEDAAIIIDIAADDEIDANNRIEEEEAGDNNREIIDNEPNLVKEGNNGEIIANQPNLPIEEERNNGEIIDNEPNLVEEGNNGEIIANQPNLPIEEERNNEEMIVVNEAPQNNIINAD